MHRFTIAELNWLKVEARKLGYGCQSNYVAVLAAFWKKHSLVDLSEYGKQWEIVAFFVLGTLQASMRARRINFWVNTEVALDRLQIDLEINQHPIQLKLGWSDAAAQSETALLSPRGITLVNAGLDQSGIDVFREILKAAGFSSEAIEVEVLDNPGMDAAEEVFEWFIKGIQ